MSRVNSFASWFSTPVLANRPEDEIIRESVLGQLYEPKAIAVSKFDGGDPNGFGEDRFTIVRIETGRVILSTEYDDEGEPFLAHIDYVPDGKNLRYVFWVNFPEILGIRDVLRRKWTRGVCRVSADSLFSGVVVPAA